MAEQAVASLKQGLLGKNQQLKNDSFKALLALAKESPSALYPEWDFCAGLIAPDQGADLKYIGVYLLANLTAADKEQKFARLFEGFYALLDDASIIPSAHTAAVSGLIAHNLPELQSRITARLLDIDRTHHPPARRDLIKSYAIQALGEYFVELDPGEQARVLEFVRAQQRALSPKTRKVAKAFLLAWEKA